MKYLDNFGSDVVAVQFDSFTDMAGFITEKRKEYGYFSILRSNRSSWNNYCDFDDTYKQMLYGYTDFNQEMIEGLREFTDAGLMARGGLCMDTEGYSYDMGAVVQGIPECCISDNDIEEKKHIRVVASVGFNSSTDSRYIINRGVAIANLVGTLMLKGYVVDLDFVMAYNPTNESFKKCIFFLRIPTGTFCASTIAFVTSTQFLRLMCIGVCDFILGKNIDGHATGYKTQEVLDWCKNNSLYFEDGYEIGLNSLVRTMYETPEKAQKSINNAFNYWLEHGKS